jgi:hypothetical protein
LLSVKIQTSFLATTNSAAYFRELRIFLTRDPGRKNSGPGSGINVPDPQHCVFHYVPQQPVDLLHVFAFSCFLGQLVSGVYPEKVYHCHGTRYGYHPDFEAVLSQRKILLDSQEVSLLRNIRITYEKRFNFIVPDLQSTDSDPGLRIRIPEV